VLGARKTPISMAKKRGRAGRGWEEPKKKVVLRRENPDRPSKDAHAEERRKKRDKGRGKIGSRSITCWKQTPDGKRSAEGTNPKGAVGGRAKEVGMVERKKANRAKIGRGFAGPRLENDGIVFLVWLMWSEKEGG